MRGNTITSYSTTDTAYQLFAELRFAPYLALEGQYMNLGTNSSSLGPVAQLTALGSYHSQSNTYNRFVWGGGLGLVFVSHLDVRLEYDVLNIQNTSRSNALWLTAAFNF